jgi:regulator of sigma E protease
MNIASVIWVVLFISVLIVIHEFGHLILAKLARIPVEVFSLGFGPVLLKRRVGGTEYRLSLVPLGGFIKMVGEEEPAGPAPDASVEPGPGIGFMSKPFGVRAAVIAAGPVSNLVLGFVMLLVMYLLFGVKYVNPVVEPQPGSAAAAAGFQTGDVVLFAAGETIPTFDQLDAVLLSHRGREVPVTVQRSGMRQELTYSVPKESADLNPVLLPVVDRVREGSPAAKVGLEPGDVITSVAGVPVNRWEDFVTNVTGKPGVKIPIAWRRGSREFSDSITPASERDQMSDQRVGQIGVWVRLPKRSLALPTAAWEATKRTGYVVVQTFVIIWKVISRQISTKAIGGPIMVAKIAYEGANWGAEYFIALWALLSINLFVVNLLPVPVLDGGRILLDAIGAVRRRPLSLRETNWAGYVGWAMIGLLVLFTIFNDVLRLIRR